MQLFDCDWKDKFMRWKIIVNEMYGDFGAATPMKSQFIQIYAER